MTLRIYVITILSLAFFNNASAQLSAKTTQEIQLLINEKNSRSPEQQKLDSRLLQYIREQRGQAMTAGVELEAIKMNADSKGSLKVDIRADVNDNLLTKIEALGGKIIFSSALFHSITVEINPGVAEKIASFPEVNFIEPTPIPVLEGGQATMPNLTSRSENIPPARSKVSFEYRAKRIKEIVQKYLKSAGASTHLFSGSVNSQGDKAHKAEDARNAYGYAGQGIRIGVLSDSYNFLGRAAEDVASGNLPGPGNPLGNSTPVTVLQDYIGGTDEGRAMLQIVHDLAPKAQLYFATADYGPASFASNIISLRNAPYNCDVIIDDIFYYNEPAFYDGLIARAVNTVTATGALYFSSAGNAGSISKNTAGVYEADFNDTGLPVFTGSTKLGTVHNFGTTVAPVNGDSIAAFGRYYNLHWADPAQASGNDYDLFLVSANGTVKASSTNVQNGSQDPYEEIAAPALVAGDRLIVFKTAAAAPRAFHLNTNRGRLKYATVGQTHGHSAAADAYSVSATPAAQPFTDGTQSGPFPGAFSSANKVETFSSDGPRRIFFNANGTPVTPGNFLFGTNGGVVRNKPDITAADGVVTTVPSLNPFYGTSAAAPHAGAITALLKSANPSITPAQVRTILTITAVDIEGAGYDNLSGYGILQAFQAMQLLSPAPQATISLGTVTAAEGNFNNNNGTLDPGETSNLSIQLNNPSMKDATGVSAVLSTTTPGVTVVNESSGYGTVNAGGNAVNATSFVIAVNSSLQCSAVLNFRLTVSFSGGSSPQIFLFSLTTGSQPFTGINATLGGTPPSGTGYTVTSGQQTGRLVRGATASTCSVPVPNPGLTVITGSRQYDAYTFTNVNSTSQCITVMLTSTNGLNIYTVAYNETGFVPSNPSANYIAEPGQSALTQLYSFVVAAGKAFTVVVHDVNVIPASNSPYTLNVSLANCMAGPACSPVNITTDTLAAGATGIPYSQPVTATGGSANYSFSYTGILPAGLSLVGNTLAGTPTQAGTFPINIIATDPTGCPADTNSYSLVISGILPASVKAIHGTPQTVFTMADFPDSLQVMVTDINSNPLSGVNVVFTAPAAGAGGTFAGGLKTVTVVTNAAGIATAPKFTSNATTGSYLVTASVVGVTDATFNLNNFCPAPFVVTSSADSGPGTLRDIVNNGCAEISVIFDPSVTSIVLTSGEIVVNKAITITGPGASRLTISGNNKSRIFNITAGAATVSISGMTIRDGQPTNVPYGGGGILVNNGPAAGTVNITGCVITSNDASFTYYQAGGGIDNESGKVNIDRSSIISNTSYRGGAIHNLTYGSMTINNSTIAGNTAGAGDAGGGIYSALPLTITSSTVYGNSALRGANLYRASDTIRLNNTIVASGTLLGTGGSGPDLSGGGYRSNDYNFIQSLLGSGTIVGVTSHNITGRNPMLLPLANYGGETPALLPQPLSPVINAGDPSVASTTDQRNFPRTVSGQKDIGAIEGNYSLVTTGGTPQTTAILSPFSMTLAASVTESGNNINGVNVIFSAPVSGASGIFPNGLTRDTVSSGMSGIINSRRFTANGVIGMYLDTASIGTAFPNGTYSLTNTIALPLVFGAVTASASNCTTNITWKTQAEINNKNFTVEYSEDGVNYVAVATLPAKGTGTATQDYAYRHSSPQEGIHYYRIKQTDLNDHFTYSNVLIVANKCGNQPIVVYPNPVKNKLIVVMPGADTHTLTVFDAAGQKTFQQVINGGTYEINATGWIKGAYTLSISQKGHAAYVMKLLKE